MDEYLCCGERFEYDLGKYGCPWCGGDNVATLVTSSSSRPHSVFAVDPGYTQSAYAALRVSAKGALVVDTSGIVPNNELLEILRATPLVEMLVLEQIAGMGMAVGREVFETAFWSGRFAEAWAGTSYARVPRHAVKMHLCGNMKAKDANIRAAVLDRFGGKEVAVGTKKKPGQLYGVRADVWAALGVGLTYLESVDHFSENGKADG